MLFSMGNIQEATNQKKQISSKKQFDDIHKDMAEEDETILMLFRIGKPISEVPRSMRMDAGDFIEGDF
ncbi:hypothetical protein MNBD_BACTEROID07-245 [hydrothermal vent metagenome]|uniref:Uncharacterized protein n=1 Tax=hydrothermal vent metagenome TaxID=652676 RepID=A0A3B0USX2_9ZZZZ